MACLGSCSLDAFFLSFIDFSKIYVKIRGESMSEGENYEDIDGRR